MNGIDVKVVHAMLREIAQQRSMRGVRQRATEFIKALDDSDALATLAARWVRSDEPSEPEVEEPTE